MKTIVERLCAFCRKDSPIIIALILTIALMPIAYADSYRLVKEMTGNESIVYDYDRSGTIQCVINYYDGKEDSRTEYFYRDANTLDRKEFSFSDGDGFTLCFHYDDKGTQIELKNPGMGGDLYWTAEGKPSFKWDNKGRITMVIVDGEEDYPDQAWYYSYDSVGRIMTFEVSGYRRDKFTYYSNGEFTRTSTYLQTNETVVTERFNSAGRLIESTDQYGMTSRYVYDQKGMLSEKYYDGKLEYRCSYDYDKNGNISAMTTSYPDGNKIQTEYRYEKA